MFEWNQFGLQDRFSPAIEEFLLFHDYLILILVFIITGVGYMLLALGARSFSNHHMVEGQVLEALWTLLPGVILVGIAVPSLALLYRLDCSYSRAITLKVLGHQWYWSYEYRDFWAPGARDRVVGFDSYITPMRELDPGMFRLLETDNRPSLPFLTNIRVLVSRADVLHSWAVPRLGVKLDATPGRLNQVRVLRYRPGVLYGQCSEICGANHRFMPITLQFVSVKDFLRWLTEIA